MIADSLTIWRIAKTRFFRFGSAPRFFTVSRPEIDGGLISLMFPVGVAVAFRPGMTPDEMKRRTKKFALDIVQFVLALRPGLATEVIGRQLIRSGTGTASNYRRACRAKSKRDFISKMSDAEEEADESAM